MQFCLVAIPYKFHWCVLFATFSAPETFSYSDILLLLILLYLYCLLFYFNTAINELHYKIQ